MSTINGLTFCKEIVAKTPMKTGQTVVEKNPHHFMYCIASFIVKISNI
jgi:hypothetical protein